MKNYGEILKEHRTARAKTLLEVEKETGISNENLSRWERGKNLPNIDFCIRLADYYEITLDELVGRDTIPMKKSTVIYNNSTHNGNNKF